MKKIYSLLLLAGLFLLGAQNVMATDYCVAGTMNSWSDGSAMVYDAVNGYYYTEFNDHMSGEQQFKIKVVGDGSWNPQWNASNIDNSLGDGTITLAGEDQGNIVFTPNGRPYIIYFKLSSGKVWACDKVILEPFVSLASDKVNLLAGETVTLTATTEHFSGAVSFTYSYSTDGGANYTPIATTSSNTQTFTIGASGTEYKFKVVASYLEEVAEATPIDVYSVVCTVAGNQENIFGTAWDPTNTDNDMTYNEGVFTWTKQVYLTSAETMSFKVTLNHSWDESYPGEDYNKDLAVGYNVITITLNWDTKAVGCEVVNYPKVEVAGDFNEWTLEELAYNPSGYVYKNIPVTAGSKAFKLKINDAWQGNSGTMTRINCENWTFAEDANCHLLADVDGYYTFFYNGGKLSVSYPTSFTRVVNNTNYQTLCVPFDAVKPEGVAIYEVTNVTESSVTIGTPDIAYLEAGHSYIIKPEVVADIIINMKDEGTEVAAPIDTHMFGILGADFKPTAALGAYILSENEFHLVAADNVATVSSTRAYVKVTDPNAAPALRIVEAGNEATDIRNIEGNETAVKFIENGKLFIKKNGVVYDAVGTVVK